MFEITGLEELGKQLSQLEQNAKRLDGEHTVSFDSSLDEFVRENTSFDDWHSMQEKAAELWALKRLGL